MRRPPLTDLRPRRIALIKPSALGDIVHSLPVLTALRRRYPDAHIAWIINRAYEPLLLGHPDLDETVPFDRRTRRKSLVTALLGLGGFLRYLPRPRFGITIELHV